MVPPCRQESDEMHWVLHGNDLAEQQVPRAVPSLVSAS